MEADAVALDLATRLLAGTSYVIVPKAKVEALDEAERLQRPWNLIEFAKWTGHSPKWVKQNILYVPRIKAKIDQATGGWIKYSSGNGSPWAIPVEQTKKFVIENKLLEK